MRRFRSRHLAKDYERLPESSEAMIRLMLARLALKLQAKQQYKQYKPSRQLRSSFTVDDDILAA